MNRYWQTPNSFRVIGSNYAVASDSRCACVLTTLVSPNSLFSLSLLRLTHLDLSRNQLKGLPPSICQLTDLRSLILVGNNLRHNRLQLPALATLKHLHLLDLSYNPAKKLKRNELPDWPSLLIAEDPPLASSIDASTSLTSTLLEHPASIAQSFAWGVTLEQQLHPLSTPHLRRRLATTFKTLTPDTASRDTIMTTLLRCYSSSPLPRTVIRASGTPLGAPIIREILRTLRSLPWPSKSDRPTVNSQHYIVLDRCEMEHKGATSCFLELYGLCCDALKDVGVHDSDFSAIAVSKGFTASPHMDSYDVAPQFAAAFGDFGGGEKGGCLCVERDAGSVVEVNTCNRVARCDGRFVHWVSKYEGER